MNEPQRERRVAARRYAGLGSALTSDLPVRSALSPWAVAGMRIEATSIFLRMPCQARTQSSAACCPGQGVSCPGRGVRGPGRGVSCPGRSELYLRQAVVYVELISIVAQYTPETGYSGGGLPSRYSLTSSTTFLGEIGLER